MTVIIKCETCNEEMGTLAKEEITAEDVAKYRAMMTCSSGHRMADLVEPE